MKIAHLTTVDLSLRYLVFAQLVAARQAGCDAIGISAAGPWVEEIERAGIRHVPLPSSTRGVAPLADVRAAWQFWKILRAERPDIVHTHNPKPGIYGRILARFAGVPIVINTVHGLYAAPDDKLIKRAIVYVLEAIAARFSDVELVQSAEDLALMNKLHIARRGRARLLGNGIDLARYDPNRPGRRERAAVRSDLAIDPGDIVVGMVGRLVAEKGYPELFAAARQLGPGYVVVAIGPEDPDKPDALPAETIEQAQRDGVRFLGMRTDLDDIYGAMDMFVLPSHREGFPRAAMEAAAMGLPVIATDIRGCREVVDHGSNGLLIEVGSPQALADAITKLGTDGELRSAMGSASRSKALEDFDERRVVERVLGAYRDIADEQGRVEYRTQLAGHGQNEPLMSIRPATLADVPAIARMHIDGIATGFLPRLGPRFMRRLYRAMVMSETAVVLIADDDSGPVGYVAGAENTGAFYREFVATSGLAAGLTALPRLARPSNSLRAWQTARYGGGDAGWPAAELLAMAVTPSRQGQGIGRHLGSELLSEFAARGIDRVKVVVGDGNDGAVRAYEKMGFVAAGFTEVHPGERSQVLVWSQQA